MGRWNANIPVRLASALARVTRALELLDHARTKPLQADLDSTALAIGALGRLLAVLAARALARRADDAARNAKLGRLAVVQVLERDDRRVDNVLRLPRAAAASASAAKPSATKPSAKELLENGAGTAHAAAHAARTVLEALLAILVVHLALVLVAQHLKGVLHLLELGGVDLCERVLLAVHDAGLERHEDLGKGHRRGVRPECLKELLEVAPSTVVEEGDSILIRHCWTERRMTPLNIYLEHASETQTHDALLDYGKAIKELAAANIFPGDMLLKNFGVTRHGRVVFYDYDEISYLTEVNFRVIPEALYPEQEMASEPWYSVAPNDVFPEEFPVFLFADIRHRRQFAGMHGDLFEASYWKSLQAQIEAGQVIDVYPYRRAAVTP